MKLQGVSEIGVSELKSASSRYDVNKTVEFKQSHLKF